MGELLSNPFTCISTFLPVCMSKQKQLNMPLFSLQLLLLLLLSTNLLDLFYSIDRGRTGHEVATFQYLSPVLLFTTAVSVHTHIRYDSCHGDGSCSSRLDWCCTGTGRLVIVPRACCWCSGSSCVCMGLLSSAHTFSLLWMRSGFTRGVL